MDWTLGHPDSAVVPWPWGLYFPISPPELAMGLGVCNLKQPEEPLGSQLRRGETAGPDSPDFRQEFCGVQTPCIGVEVFKAFRLVALQLGVWESTCGGCPGRPYVPWGFLIWGHTVPKQQTLGSPMAGQPATQDSRELGRFPWSGLGFAWHCGNGYISVKYLHLTNRHFPTKICYIGNFPTSSAQSHLAHPFVGCTCIFYAVQFKCWSEEEECKSVTRSLIFPDRERRQLVAVSVSNDTRSLPMENVFI